MLQGLYINELTIYGLFRIRTGSCPWEFVGHSCRLWCSAVLPSPTPSCDRESLNSSRGSFPRIHSATAAEPRHSAAEHDHSGHLTSGN